MIQELDVRVAAGRGGDHAGVGVDRGAVQVRDQRDEGLAQCLAVAYLPVDEDSYGYPSLEASHSSKAIVTLTDAGGALEFVRDGVSGLVAEPDPASLAAAFDRLYEDRAATERMGERSAARRAELNISWEHTIDRLLGTE